MSQRENDFLTVMRATRSTEMTAMQARLLEQMIEEPGATRKRHSARRKLMFSAPAKLWKWAVNALRAKALFASAKGNAGCTKESSRRHIPRAVAN